ncbi:hypothetical protein KAJ38_03470 [Candidatus Pacearchaeota archaeon]|nr:hypothetical protein [Candidatus Pacearchaeota archaeon]
MKQSGVVFVGILIVCLVLAVGYIVFDKYQEVQQEEQLSIFQQGAQYGYEQAIVQLVQQAVTCQQVPISIKNQTVNLIAVECLQTE